MTPKELGEYGEELATLHLIKQGYTILERNWFFGKNEVDIICQKEEGVLVVVEVKARNSDFFGDPQSFVSTGKQKSIVKVSNEYVLENDLDVEVRFDIIAVLKNSKQERLEHFEDAFYFF
ncbi:YraN family protein [Dokdonia sp. PRO95]|jgi:putative endonuclease|uniref:YraN family protein n=1 Tax=Dokdonia sp. PRO95 TaxID=1239415 RepID=UPI000555B14D|nr:YraN family protein [Dokdonia sp. PRO95]MDE0597727.1 YraN family protein [Dokdonia donghaensis]